MSIEDNFIFHKPLATQESANDDLNGTAFNQKNFERMCSVSHEQMEAHPELFPDPKSTALRYMFDNMRPESLIAFFERSTKEDWMDKPDVYMLLREKMENEGLVALDETSPES